MRKQQAAVGSAVFFVVAPCVVAGVLPWWITRWNRPTLSSWLGAGSIVVGCALVLAGLVLLVRAFARFVSEALGALGYRVLSALNGRAALEIWATHRDEIDLLLTDVVMPESISGRQLAHTLIMDKPNLKVIFTSGYSAELFGSDFEREKEHGFLAKPYLPDRLAQIVATHLLSRPAVVR